MHIRNQHPKSGLISKTIFRFTKDPDELSKVTTQVTYTIRAYKYLKINKNILEDLDETYLKSPPS